MNVFSLNTGTSVYVSPAMEYIELFNEGILCASDKDMASGIDDMTEVDFSW